MRISHGSAGKICAVLLLLGGRGYGPEFLHWSTRKLLVVLLLQERRLDPGVPRRGTRIVLLLLPL